MFSEQFTPEDIETAIKAAVELFNAGPDDLSKLQTEVLNRVYAARERGFEGEDPLPMTTTIIRSAPETLVPAVIDPHRNVHIPLGSPHGHEPFFAPIYGELDRSAADQLRGAIPHFAVITLAAQTTPHPVTSLYDSPGIHLHLLRGAYQQAVLVRTDVTAPAFPHCCAVVLPSLASGLAHLAAIAESID